MAACCGCFLQLLVLHHSFGHSHANRRQNQSMLLHPKPSLLYFHLKQLPQKTRPHQITIPILLCLQKVRKIACDLSNLGQGEMGELGTTGNKQFLFFPQQILYQNWGTCCISTVRKNRIGWVQRKQKQTQTQSLAFSDSRGGEMTWWSFDTKRPRCLE